MIYLKPGDRLPIVATCQVLLNAYRLLSSDIDVDGIFGTKTETAARLFQKQHQDKLSVTGHIDEKTWELLASGNQLSIHDSVDIFDPDLNSAVATLHGAGANPVMVGGLCNGVGALYGQLVASGVQQGKLALLRFHGHGNKGKQVVSYGTGAHVLFDAIRHELVRHLRRAPQQGDFPASELAAVQLEIDHSQISFKTLSDPDVLSQFVQLAPFFHTLGSIEFHGCQVGGGAEGERMLQRVADILGVPAAGALHKQTTGNAVEYSGGVRVQVPGGGDDLRGWAKKLPAITSYG
jgi:Putative peptidoglycan binding domain